MNIDGKDSSNVNDQSQDIPKPKEDMINPNDLFDPSDINPNEYIDLSKLDKQLSKERYQLFLNSLDGEIDDIKKIKDGITREMEHSAESVQSTNQLIDKYKTDKDFDIEEYIKESPDHIAFEINKKVLMWGLLRAYDHYCQTKEELCREAKQLAYDELSSREYFKEKTAFYIDRIKNLELPKYEYYYFDINNVRLAKVRFLFKDYVNDYQVIAENMLYIYLSSREYGNEEESLMNLQFDWAEFLLIRMIVAFLKDKLSDRINTPFEVSINSPTQNNKQVSSKKSLEAYLFQQEIIINTDMILPLRNALEPYFKSSDSEILKHVLEGGEIAHKLVFQSNQNQLAELFRRLHYNKKIVGSLKDIERWLCKYFSLSDTQNNTTKDLNNNSVYNTLRGKENCEPPKKKRIDVQGIPYKNPAQLKREVQEGNL